MREEAAGSREPGKAGRGTGRRALCGCRSLEKSRFRFLEAESYIPEMWGGASTLTTSVLTLHAIHRLQLDLGIVFCFLQGQKFKVLSFAGC